MSLQTFLTEANHHRCVKLRGLPYTVTKTEIINFFKSEKRVSESDIVLEVKNGKQTGLALVFLPSKTDVDNCIEMLNRKTIGSRYIELFSVELRV